MVVGTTFQPGKEVLDVLILIEDIPYLHFMSPRYMNSLLNGDRDHREYPGRIFPNMSRADRDSDHGYIRRPVKIHPILPTMLGYWRFRWFNVDEDISPQRYRYDRNG